MIEVMSFVLAFALSVLAGRFCAEHDMSVWAAYASGLFIGCVWSLMFVWLHIW